MFTVRPKMGEEDSFMVYPDPDIKVLEKLRESKTIRRHTTAE